MKIPVSNFCFWLANVYSFVKTKITLCLCRKLTHGPLTFLHWWSLVHCTKLTYLILTFKALAQLSHPTWQMLSPSTLSLSFPPRVTPDLMPCSYTYSHI